MNLLYPFEALIGWLIAEIYEFIPNVGLAIILVTMLVMLLIFPLTHKQTKSTLAMQSLQPQVKELRKKYADDKQKQSEEMMALYKEAGVNPLGGCLPLLIQMPFLLAIFRVIKDTQKYIGTNTQLFKDFCSPMKTYEMCTASASELEKAGYSAKEAQYYASKLPASKEFLGLHISTSLKVISSDGFVTMLPYILMMILMVVVSFMSMHRQQQLNTNTPQQMKMLKYIFPAGMIFSGLYFPAGTNLYILTSSSWRLCQQEFLYRKIINPHKEKQAAKSKTNNDAEDKSSYRPGLARQKRKKK